MNIEMRRALRADQDKVQDETGAAPYLAFGDEKDPCPDCGRELVHVFYQGGGVKCRCGYWFCF